MGFTAIWISPIVKNVEGSTIDGDSYHGYWAQKINSLNDRFGSASDFQNLVNALHSRGMYLMVDVVTNHMAHKGPGNSVDYSAFDVFNSKNYYHDFCLITNYDDPVNTQTCWAGSNTVSLPDLRTEDSNVRSMWNTWVKDFVTKYNIDGLRIDSCTSVELGFFDDFVDAAGVYAICEAFHGNPDVVCPYQEHMPGAMNYPAYFWIKRAFQSTSGTMAELANGVNWMKGACADTTLLGSFIENHDNPRFPSFTSDQVLTKNAIAYAMLADGIPIIYQGQEQYYSGDLTPINREPIWASGYSTSSPLYTFIATLNAMRNWAIFKDMGYTTYKAEVAYSDDHTIAIRKGSDGLQVVSVASNIGSSASPKSFTLTGTEFPAGSSVTDVLSCQTFTVDGSGNIALTISGGAPRVLYPTSPLSGSGLCNSATRRGLRRRQACTASSKHFFSLSSTAGGGYDGMPEPTRSAHGNDISTSAYETPVLPGSDMLSSTSTAIANPTSSGPGGASYSRSATYNSFATRAETSASGDMSSSVAPSISVTSTSSTSSASSTPSVASSSSTSAPSASACANLPKSVTVNFSAANVTTNEGDAVVLVGLVAGNGDPITPEFAVPLNVTQCATDTWSVSLELTPGKTYLYRYVKIGEDGSEVWETEPNRSYLAPSTCPNNVEDSWR